MQSGVEVRRENYAGSAYETLQLVPSNPVRSFWGMLLSFLILIFHPYLVSCPQL